MSFFERAKKAVKDWMQRAGAATGVAREFKDIFELGGVPAYSQFYNFGIFVWKWLYRGLYKPWHIVPAPTIANPAATREMARMDTAKAICAELASLVFGDAVEINVSRKGWTAETPDPLGEFVADVLKENAFSTKMQEHCEQALALGGGALKVWYEPKRGTDKKPMSGEGRVRIGFAMADQFVPTAWDNARVTDGVFISRVAKNGYYYTRLEWHKWDGETYVISNELFKADMDKGRTPDTPQDILGFRTPLAEIYPMLAENVTFDGLEQSLFSYYRTPIANNIDDNSPLGVSLYANALSTLRSIDTIYDSFVREFRLGKKRIIVPYNAVQTVTDPATGQMLRYFDANCEAYEALNTDNPDSLKVQDNSIELRVDEHVAAMNAFLNILCLQTGLSLNTFSFDTRGGMKTATEVVSENSKTYKTVKTMQAQLAPAIESLVRNIITVAGLYDVQWKGQSVAAMASQGYDVCITFDDGITQDRQTNINEGMALVGAGLMSKFTFLTDPKFGQGLTPEQADAEIKRIQDEQGGRIDALDILNSAE